MKDLIVTPADGSVWVTGASSGIGRSLCLAYAQKGWTVGATARRLEALEALAAEAEAKGLEGRIVPLAGDITDPAAMTEVVETLAASGPIALAVLNAGVYEPLDAPDFDAALFQKIININLNGTANCLEPLVKHMVDREKGHIALVASVTGYGGLPLCAAYGATKAGLNNLAQCLKIELQPWNVRVTIVNPGFVDTPAQDDNDFPKPAIVSSEKAAQEIVKGLSKTGFEVTFPKRFTYFLKVLNMLPRGLYLRMVRKSTGWHERKPRKGASATQV